MERRVLILRNFLYLAIKLGGRSLIDAALIGQSTLADCLQYTQYTCGIYVCCELRGVKADLNVALSCQVVDFVGLNLIDDGDDAHGVTEVTKVQVEVLYSLQVSDSFTVVGGRTSYHTMYVIAFF
jgi:hypothetical protein